MTDEKWLPVVGHEGLYEVSDQGRVKKLSKGIVLNQHEDSWGYKRVSLKGDHGYKVRLVHVLVAQSFIGPYQKGKVVCHGPNGQHDNSLANLYYSTQSINTKEDKRRDGTANIGDAHPCAKITEDVAIEILNLKGKMLQADIAAKFSVSQQTVSAIQVGRKWPHLQTEEGRAMATHATRNAVKKRHLSPFL
jgi:hypothetical protein